MMSYNTMTGECKEIFLGATNFQEVRDKARTITNSFQHRGLSETWLNTQFLILSRVAIAKYALEYADATWKNDALKRIDLVEELAQELRHYYMEVNV